MAVELGAYQIQRYPVTNAQYAAFVRETGYHPGDGDNFLLQLRGGLTAVSYTHLTLPTKA